MNISSRTASLFLFCTFALSVENVYSTALYVDRYNSVASDFNNGSVEKPWKTLTKAARSAQAGDTVWIRAGTYSEGLHIDQQSGQAGSPIVFRAAPDDVGAVILTGRCVTISEQSHIEVRDLKIQNCNNVGTNDQIGIRIIGPGVTDIVISGNHIYNTYSSAISAWGVPWGKHQGNFRNITNLVIENNVIEKANNGGYNEQITVANGVENFIIRNNELKSSGASVHGGEGIDIKEGCAYGKIYHNHIHDLIRRGLYIDGGGRSARVSPTHDIEINGNLIHGVPSGLAIMSEGGGDVYNVKIYNNVIYDTENDCSFIYDHPNAADHPGEFWNIEYVNNTFWNCAGKSIDVNTSHAKMVLIRNNILNSSIRDKTGGATTEDHNIEGGDPRFVNAGRGDFHIRSGSPAINAGALTGAPSEEFDGLRRPCGDGVDIGAFEFKLDCSVVVQ